MKKKKSWKGSGDAAVEDIWFGIKDKLGATEFLGYETDQAEGVILSLLKDNKEIKELKSNDEGKEIYGDLLSNVGKIQVKSQTLDDYLNENSIEQVDLLKLDLQGSELPALIGASNSLSEGKVKCILCEIMFQPHYESQPSASAILQELIEKHDFNLFNLYQHNYHHGYLCQSDVLIFHSSIDPDIREKAHLAFHSHSKISLNP